MSVEKEQLQNIYNDIEDAVSDILKDPSQTHLDELKLYINKFFNDSKCLGVIWTENFDKLFFGLYVFPKVSGDDVVKILYQNERFIVKEYWLELDSRLFRIDLGLSAKEITALIVHDIAHLVNNSSPAQVIKKEIDSYLAENNTVLKISDSVHYRGILAYGFADAMRKYTTIFEEDHYEPNNITDEVIDWIDYTSIIRNAFDKISRMGMNINREITNKFITLSWVLRIYKDIKHNRIPAIEGIKRCIELSPSTIEKRELKLMSERLQRIDDDSLLEGADIASISNDEEIIRSIRESITVKPRHLYRSYNLLECVSDDIDALMKEKNTYNEPDGLSDVLHRMNHKMACIQDLVANTDPMSKEEYDQWNVMFQNLDRQRKDLTNGELYSSSRKLINTYTKYGDQ